MCHAAAALQCNIEGCPDPILLCPTTGGARWHRPGQLWVCKLLLLDTPSLALAQSRSAAGRVSCTWVTILGMHCHRHRHWRWHVSYDWVCLARAGWTLQVLHSALFVAVYVAAGSAARSLCLSSLKNKDMCFPWCALERTCATTGHGHVPSTAYWSVWAAACNHVRHVVLDAQAMWSVWAAACNHVWHIGVGSTGNVEHMGGSV